jgi:hypothetical protein
MNSNYQIYSNYCCNTNNFYYLFRIYPFIHYLIYSVLFFLTLKLLCPDTHILNLFKIYFTYLIDYFIVILVLY